MNTECFNQRYIRHKEELIDDTVALARLDTEHIGFHPEMSDIPEIIQEAVYSLRTELEGRSPDISPDEKVPARNWICFDILRCIPIRYFYIGSFSGQYGDLIMATRSMTFEYS